MRVVEVKITATGEKPVPVVVQIETKVNDTWKVEKVHDLMTSDAQKKVLIEDNQRVVVYGPPTVEYVFDREQNASVAKPVEFVVEKPTEAQKEFAKPSAQTPVGMNNPTTQSKPFTPDSRPATTGTQSGPQTGGQASKGTSK